MASIHYMKGDATLPIGDRNKIIAHVCNDIGAWGAGFVMAISNRWKTPEKKYKEWYYSKHNFSLGHLQYVQVEKDIVVANMIAQHGLRSKTNPIPIKYDALETCLSILVKICKENYATVHMPKIGCGLAGGKWEIVEKIIHKTLIENDIDVFVYEYVVTQQN